jgi:hypothetical protein
VFGIHTGGTARYNSFFRMLFMAVFIAATDAAESEAYLDECAA